MMMKALRRTMLAGLGAAADVWEKSRGLGTRWADRGEDILTRGRQAAQMMREQRNQKKGEENPPEAVPHRQEEQDDPLETLRTLIKGLTPEQRKAFWSRLGD